MRNSHCLRGPTGFQSTRIPAHHKIHSVTLFHVASEYLTRVSGMQLEDEVLQPLVWVVPVVLYIS